ncbi:cholesterol oxidase substrate-binding domain-containing protein [Veronia pacifica]|uniref:cholesterol oxidase substrate-binding domain-containing protein n=1 Tax=Veronia pacifica TaxID=1080227 RepID=UPI0015869778|nr:cholesterol oxidase substrate-binding domain-containing protein [Veronia pacifica]
MYSNQGLETLADWALNNNYYIKAFGSMHNWSPLIISEEASDKKALLIDISQFDHLDMVSSAEDHGVVRAGGGVQAEALYQYLSDQPGGNPNIPGYAFSNTPAPGNLSLAGMLSIGGHGTKVDYQDSTENEYFNGSISNCVLSLTVMVWNGEKYAIRTFQRGEEDGDLFLTALGSTIIIEATLFVLPNYNLRCQSFTNIHHTELFAETASESPLTISNIIDDAGRMEVIWFPFSQYPWLKVWTNEPEKPPSSRRVSGAYNYPFSDNIPVFISDFIKSTLVANPSLVPAFGKLQAAITSFALKGGAKRETLFKKMTEPTKSRRGETTTDVISEAEFNIFEPYIKAVEHTLQGNSHTRSFLTQSNDLWGDAWKTLVYVRETTLRITANGYAVHLNRSDIQSFLHDFTQVYLRLQDKYASRGQYPMAGPMEIRITGTDTTNGLNILGAKPPAFSATTATTDSSLDSVVWLDLLTFSDMPEMGALYQEIENWLYEKLPAEQIRVEWSKGWGYNASGPWQNHDFIANTLRDTFASATSTYENTVARLRRYDPHYLFSSPFIKKLVP